MQLSPLNLSSCLAWRRLWLGSLPQSSGKEKLEERLLGSGTLLTSSRGASQWGQSVTGSIFSAICQEYFQLPILIRSPWCKRERSASSSWETKGIKWVFWLVLCCELALLPDFKCNTGKDGGRVFPGYESQGLMASEAQESTKEGRWGGVGDGCGSEGEARTGPRFLHCMLNAELPSSVSETITDSCSHS